MNRTVSLLLACAGGVALAVQARLTGALKVQVGDGSLAAAVTFGTGMVFMLVVSCATRANRQALAGVISGVVQRRFPPVFLLSGLMGGYAVFGQGATVDLLGVAVYSLTFIAGQMIASVVLDGIGWVPAGRKAMTGARALGTSLAIIGIVLAIMPRVLDPGGGSGAAGKDTSIAVPLVVAILIVFSAGLMQPGQMAMNGVVGAAIVRPAPVALITYTVGTVLLTILAWPAIADGGLSRLPMGWENAWYYIGGFLGSIIVIGGTLLTRTIGSLLFTLGMVSGQVCGSLIIDAFWPLPGTIINGLTVAGGVLTVISLAVASGLGPWRSRPPERT